MMIEGKVGKSEEENENAEEEAKEVEDRPQMKRKIFTLSFAVTNEKTTVTLTTVTVKLVTLIVFAKMVEEEEEEEEEEAAPAVNVHECATRPPPPIVFSPLTGDSLTRKRAVVTDISSLMA